jgi:hypothetical protein
MPTPGLCRTAKRNPQVNAAEFNLDTA